MFFRMIYVLIQYTCFSNHAIVNSFSQGFGPVKKSEFNDVLFDFGYQGLTF